MFLNLAQTERMHHSESVVQQGRGQILLLFTGIPLYTPEKCAAVQFVPVPLLSLENATADGGLTLSHMLP